MTHWDVEFYKRSGQLGDTREDFPKNAALFLNQFATILDLKKNPKIILNIETSFLPNSIEVRKNVNNIFHSKSSSASNQFYTKMR